MQMCASFLTLPGRMFMEEPGDGNGSVLVLVQLIESNGRELPDKLPTPIPPELSIIPSSRQAWIEMIIMGVRNLAPYHFRSMTSPYLVITLESLGNSYTCETNPSKTPNPDNPNFLGTLSVDRLCCLCCLYAAP